VVLTCSYIINQIQNQKLHVFIESEKKGEDKSYEEKFNLK